MDAVGDFCACILIVVIFVFAIIGVTFTYDSDMVNLKNKTKLYVQQANGFRVYSCVGFRR